MMAKQNNKGIILIFVVLILMVSSILVMSFYAAATTSYSAARKDEIRQRAYYAAESGVRYALFIIKSQPTYDPLDSNPSPTPPDPWPKGANFSDSLGNAIIIGITRPNPALDEYKITSTGTASDRSKTLTVYVDFGGNIKSWQ